MYKPYKGAFNPLTGWYDADVLGIDLGITMLMAENHRTGFVWEQFMKNPEARRGMELAGFHPANAKTAAALVPKRNELPSGSGV